jgi:hypothetical protein
MKTKSSLLQSFLCILIFLTLRPSPSALSQIPQGFNYQAIARDGSGNPISTAIDVKIAILKSADDASLIWEELHTGVDPDDHGLFSIVVGNGVTQAGGLASFSLIDWTETFHTDKDQRCQAGNGSTMVGALCHGCRQPWRTPEQA